jgi:hypothetical protein
MNRILDGNPWERDGMHVRAYRDGQPLDEVAPPQSPNLQSRHRDSNSRHGTMSRVPCFSGKPRLVAKQRAPYSWLRIES